MNRSALLTQIHANSGLISQTLSSLQSLLESNAGCQSEKIRREKDSLNQENQQLKSEIQTLVNKLNQLEGVSGPSTGAVFLDKSSAPTGAPAAPKPAPVIPNVEKKGHKEALPAEAKATGAEKKKQEQPASGKKDQSKGASDDRPVDVSRLDLRVGRIIEARKHPDADSLYVEDVDVGEGKNRTVVSGLVKFIPIEQMQNRMALLLCNLKPAKMRGVTSEAMVMCASSPEKVEILLPPKGAVPGDRVVCQGFPGEPEPQLNPKKKVFEEVAPDLKTNDQLVATYKGIPLEIPGKGFFTSATLPNVQIK